MMKKTAFLLLLLAVWSCEKQAPDPEKLGENSGIVGTWVEGGTDGDVTLLQRAMELDPERYGFIIHEEGGFTEHKNSGWCGTPPISYGYFEGTWEAVSDSLMEITVGYWGGTMTYQIRIVSLEEEALRIRYLYAEDRALSR